MPHSRLAISQALPAMGISRCDDVCAKFCPQLHKNQPHVLAELRAFSDRKGLITRSQVNSHQRPRPVTPNQRLHISTTLTYHVKPEQTVVRTMAGTSG